jgi:hypothetical protein
MKHFIPIYYVNCSYFLPCRRKGQALVEFIFSLFFLPLFIMGIISLGRIQIVKMKLHQAARHGAFLAATDRLGTSESVNINRAESEVKKFFTDIPAGAVKFDTSKLKVKIKGARLGGAGQAQKAYKCTVSYRFKVFDLSKNISSGFWAGTFVKEVTKEESVVCGRSCLFF